MQVFSTEGPPMSDRDDLEQRAWRLLDRAHTRVSRSLDRAITQQTGLSLRAYQVLVRLARAEGGALRMSELANAVLLSASGTTRLVDQLVSRGLLSRRQDATNARSQWAVLTDRGRDMCDQLTTTYGVAVTEHFAQRLTDLQ